jgi:hypothetical protein
MEQVWRRLLDDIVVVPLYRPSVLWAMRDTLKVPISTNNGPVFWQARLTSPTVR